MTIFQISAKNDCLRFFNRWNKVESIRMVKYKNLKVNCIPLLYFANFT